MPDGERRLAAIMFTDIVGFTAMTQASESQAMKVLDRHNRLLRPFFPKFHGREVKAMGDSFLVEFESALDALLCAVEMQSYLHEYNLSSEDEWKIKLRIGVHLGDVIHTGGDVFGDSVNIASRIEPLAEPEGVCLSEQVFDQIQNKFPQPLSKLEQRKLKNVQFPIDVYKVIMPWDSPPPTEVAALPLNRIAILPFANYSPDPNDEYFADGMMEELINALSKVGQLTVIARTSVIQYRNTTKRISTIARELDVGALIEGSVRKAANKVRIAVQLLDGLTEGHVWADSYDRNLDDIFEIQSDVARRVTDALKIKLLPSEKREIEKRPTDSRGAYVLYLKGRHCWNERSPQSLRTAIEYFEKAIEEDPSFALAYAGLADCYIILVDWAVVKSVEGAQKAKSLAEKALELDGSIAEAHASLGNVYTFEIWDWHMAELEYRRSIELNPKYPTARQWFGMFLSFAGRFGESLEQHEKALELDPFSPIININLATALVLAGRYSEGIEQARTTLALNPDFASGHYDLGELFVSGSEYEKAIAEFKRTLDIVPGNPVTLGLLGHAYALAGRRKEAGRLLDSLRKASQTSYVSPSSLAIVEFGLGKKDEAFRHLKMAWDERDNFLLYLKAYPGYEDVRADRRFALLLGKIGYEDREPGIKPKNQ